MKRLKINTYSKPGNHLSFSSMQVLAKESLTRSTPQMASLSPSLQLSVTSPDGIYKPILLSIISPNGIYKPIPAITLLIPHYASANFWAL